MIERDLWSVWRSCCHVAREFVKQHRPLDPSKPTASRERAVAVSYMKRLTGTGPMVDWPFEPATPSAKFRQALRKSYRRRR